MSLYKIDKRLFYFYQMRRYILPLLFASTVAHAQSQDSVMIKKLSDEIMLRGTCYENLRVLCKQVGHRLSGSPQAAEAVKWGEQAMQDAGADRVWLQPVDVPNWKRGKEEVKLKFAGDKGYTKINALAIGNSQGTDNQLLEAPLLMVGSIEELKTLPAEKVKGKVVFFNYRFRQDLINTFEGYGDAGKYRYSAPNSAAAKGAAAVIIRSVSTGADDAPHTGSMRYADTVDFIPALAVGNYTADKMEAEYKKGLMMVQIKSDTRMEGYARSYNVIGEITGTEHPERVIVVGGHLDSWDVGEGAHDDGAGCVQSIEVIRAFKQAGIRPKNTIRAVLFMNEENGLRGGFAYADSAKAINETHIAAIETDAGGFSPRGFGLEMENDKKEYIKSFRNLFLPYGIYDFEQEHGGADITPIHRMGVPAIGLAPDPQRYFDYHHTPNDVFEAVNHRELKLGAVALAAMVYVLDEHGLGTLPVLGAGMKPFDVMPARKTK